MHYKRPQVTLHLRVYIEVKNNGTKSLTLDKVVLVGQQSGLDILATSCGPKENDTRSVGSVGSRLAAQEGEGCRKTGNFGQ